MILRKKRSLILVFLIFLGVFTPSKAFFGCLKNPFYDKLVTVLGVAAVYLGFSYYQYCAETKPGKKGWKKIIHEGSQAPIQINGTTVEIVQGDITKIEADMLVNAANPQLTGQRTVGVNKAIYDAAGTKLEKYCRDNGLQCETGHAVKTPSFNIKTAQHIIHAVGPDLRNHNNTANTTTDEQLASCYRNSLQLAVQNGDRSIAFCLISAGIYGYPTDKAIEIAFKTTKEFLKNNSSKLNTVIFVGFKDDEYKAMIHKKMIFKS